MRLTWRAKATRLAHFLKALTQQHHRALIPRLGPFVPDDALVVDVGAHAGQFTKLFAKLAPRGRVIAVEPGAYARSILERVVRLRNMRNVTVVPMGLSDAPGEAALHVPVKAKGSVRFGISHLGREERAPHVNDTITLTTLDLLAQELNLPRLDFLKCDVEGWEIRMLKGGMKTIARFRPALMLELVAASLARASNAPDEAWQLLAPLGYRAEFLQDGTLAAGYSRPADYLFIPPR